eukprot:scaffold13463_cov51-Phaeocystis_antarctica.AAC.3
MVRGWYGDSSAIHRGQFGIDEGHAHAMHMHMHMPCTCTCTCHAHAHAHAMHMHMHMPCTCMLYAAYRGELVIDEGGHCLLLTTYY